MTLIEINQFKAEASKALHCLFIEVDEAVAADVKRKVKTYVEALESELERLRKQNAAMREALQWLHAGSICSDPATSVASRKDCPICKALQPDAGARYLSLEEVQPLVEALKALYDDTVDYVRINHLGDDHCTHALRMSRDALAHAKSLGQ